MTTDFAVITEDFEEDLDAIRLLVDVFDDPLSGVPKARIAAANSATLLLAATFEEFIREMARAYARTVINAAESFEKLPPRMAPTAWRRTMERIARVRIDKPNEILSSESILLDAQERFGVVAQFCMGDLSQDIYADLIHNENNMRPGEINSLFRVSNLKNVCYKVADKTHVLENFDENDVGKADVRQRESIEDFFDRRNEIAHSLHPSRSSGPDQIHKDINMLHVFGRALCETLEMEAPKAEVASTEDTPSTFAQEPTEAATATISAAESDSSAGSE